MCSYRCQSYSGPGLAQIPERSWSRDLIQGQVSSGDLSPGQVLLSGINSLVHSGTKEQIYQTGTVVVGHDWGPRPGLDCRTFWMNVSYSAEMVQVVNFPSAPSARVLLLLDQNNQGQYGGLQVCSGLNQGQYGVGLQRFVDFVEKNR